MRFQNKRSIWWILVMGLAVGAVQAILAQDPAPAATDGTIDAMDDPTVWKVYKDDRGVNVELATVEAKSGKAIDISYTMGPGEWFGVFKTVDRDVSGYKGLRFTYRGQGNPNSFECKLEDSDGSIFGKVLKTKSNIGSWTIVEIPFTDFSYWWGGDNKLALETLHNLHFAVSMKNNEDKGKSGKVSIDQVELYK